MKITSTGASARAAYYDRNASNKQQAADNTAAPHSSTTRWTYTVPSGRKAFVSSVMCMTIRQGVAGTVGIQTSVIQLTPSGGAAGTLVEAQQTNNTADALDRAILGLGATMVAGDAIAGLDADTSVTGTTENIESASITEYDA